MRSFLNQNTLNINQELSLVFEQELDANLNNCGNDMHGLSSVYGLSSRN